MSNPIWKSFQSQVFLEDYGISHDPDDQYEDPNKQYEEDYGDNEDNDDGDSEEESCPQPLTKSELNSSDVELPVFEAFACSDLIGSEIHLPPGLRPTNIFEFSDDEVSMFGGGACVPITDGITETLPPQFLQVCHDLVFYIDIRFMKTEFIDHAELKNGLIIIPGQMVGMIRVDKRKIKNGLKPAALIWLPTFDGAGSSHEDLTMFVDFFDRYYLHQYND